MSVRRALAVSAATAMMVTLPAVAGQAAPNASCSYPPNRPVLTIQASPRTTSATDPVVVFGTFTQNDCGIKAAHIVVQRQLRIDGKASGGWKAVGADDTNKHGQYVVNFNPTVNMSLRAKFAASGDLPATTSDVVVEKVRTKVTQVVNEGARCVVRVHGTTTPRKAHTVIKLQTRAKKFNGWTTLAREKTNSKGKFAIAKTLKCGKTYNLSSAIGATSRNAAGRSPTDFGVKPTA